MMPRMSDIRQTRLGFAPWADPRTRRLPGTIPVAPEDWLLTDDAFGGQMALRDDLILRAPDRVHRLDAAARPAAIELYDRILALLPARGHRIADGVATRPDGVGVGLNRDAPLLTLGRLVAEDLCLMLPGPTAEHVLAGAILCFPSGWSLHQKFMRPMMRIHEPVADYSDQLGTRVQRLLDGVRSDQGLMRGTAHYSAAPLHNPRTEEQGHDIDGPLPFIRVERQCLFRLPLTGAVVFSIHTSVIRPADLTPDQNAALAEFPIHRAA